MTELATTTPVPPHDVPRLRNAQEDPRTMRARVIKVARTDARSTHPPPSHPLPGGCLGLCSVVYEWPGCAWGYTEEHSTKQTSGLIRSQRDQASSQTSKTRAIPGGIVPTGRCRFVLAFSPVLLAPWHHERKLAARRLRSRWLRVQDQLRHGCRHLHPVRRHLHHAVCRG